MIGDTGGGVGELLQSESSDSRLMYSLCILHVETCRLTLTEGCGCGIKKEQCEREGCREIVIIIAKCSTIVN